jgi:hypothetical protein
MQTIWMTCEKKIKSNTIVYVYIAKDFRPNDSTVYDDLANVWAERRDTTGDILPCDWPVVAQLTKRGNVSLCYSLNGADGNSLFSDVESTQISRHCCRRRRKKKKTGHAHAILWAHPGDNITKSLNTESQKKERKRNAEWGHETTFWLRRSLTAVAAVVVV